MLNEYYVRTVILISWPRRIAFRELSLSDYYALFFLGRSFLLSFHFNFFFPVAAARELLHTWESKISRVQCSHRHIKPWVSKTGGSSDFGFDGVTSTVACRKEKEKRSELCKPRPLFCGRHFPARDGKKMEMNIAELKNKRKKEKRKLLRTCMQL